MRHFLPKCLENTSILNGIESRINLQLDFMVKWVKSIDTGKQHISMV